MQTNMQAIWQGIIFYIATTVIISINNTYFLIPAIAIIILNYILLHFFLKS